MTNGSKTATTKKKAQNKKKRTEQVEEDNVLDFHLYRLNKLIATMCERYHQDEDTISSIVFQLVKKDILDLQEIEETVDAFMQVQAARSRP